MLVHWCLGQSQSNVTATMKAFMDCRLFCSLELTVSVIDEPCPPPKNETTHQNIQSKTGQYHSKENVWWWKHKPPLQKLATPLLFTNDLRQCFSWQSERNTTVNQLLLRTCENLLCQLAQMLSPSRPIPTWVWHQSSPVPRGGRRVAKPASKEITTQKGTQQANIIKTGRVFHYLSLS